MAWEKNKDARCGKAFVQGMRAFANKDARLQDVLPNNFGR